MNGNAQACRPGAEDRFVIVRGVDVFDEHDERNGKGKLVRRFGKKELLRLARVNNQRARKGLFTPLVFGHTDPDQADEEKQPQPRGYARNYRVEFDSGRRQWMLRCDYHIRQRDFQKAKTFPFTSIELYPRDGVIHPISLIRRAPARDLRQWAYSRHGAVLRYSMEFSMPDRYEMDDTPPEGGGEELSHGEALEQFAKHCFSHPHAARFAKHYAMPAEVPEEEGHEPTDEPDADLPMDEEPEQHGMAPPGPSNGAPPPGGSGGHEQHRRRGTPSMFSTELANMRGGREHRRMVDLERQVAELRRDKALAEARQWVTVLAAEDFDLDADHEVQQFARLDDAGRRKRADYIRRYYRQAPVGGAPLDTSSRSVADDGEPGDEAHANRAIQYARENPGKPWDECVRATRSK